MTVYIVDMDDYIAHAREIGAVWRRLVGTDYPAMAGIGVSRLWDVEALVEVQGIAVLARSVDGDRGWRRHADRWSSARNARVGGSSQQTRRVTWTGQAARRRASVGARPPAASPAGSSSSGRPGSR